MTLTPTFNSEVLSYTATTTNATNTITATVADENATVEIDVDGVIVANGATATWASGENIVTITVTLGEDFTEYIITITKE